jgi:GAF domain-containing protein
MGFTAELAADVWAREQEIAESQILSEDMPDTLDQELAALERVLGCTFVDFFYAHKTSHLVEEEAKAWNEWFATLNNGEGGIWSELSDRIQALYDAEECHAYDCYRLAVEREDLARVYEEEGYQKLA